MSRLRKLCTLFLTFLLLPGTLLYTGPANASVCGIGSFGTEKVSGCKKGNCYFVERPPEIAHIQRGVYVEYIGLFINDGYAHWIGLNFDSGTSISVKRFAGEQAESVLRPEVESDAYYSREVISGKLHWIDFIEKRPLSAARIDELACKATPLWTTTERLFHMATDVHNALFLVDSGVTKSFGGTGLLNGLAKELSTTLHEYQTTSLPRRVAPPPSASIKKEELCLEFLPGTAKLTNDSLERITAIPNRAYTDSWVFLTVPEKDGEQLDAAIDLAFKRQDFLNSLLGDRSALLAMKDDNNPKAAWKKSSKCDAYVTYKTWRR